MCYQELNKRFAVINSNRITKKARIEATVLNSLTPISKAEICNILPDISPTTVEAVLGNPPAPAVQEGYFYFAIFISAIFCALCLR